jgi:hypothetical protein
MFEAPSVRSSETLAWSVPVINKYCTIVRGGVQLGQHIGYGQEQPPVKFFTLPPVEDGVATSEQKD